LFPDSQKKIETVDFLIGCAIFVQRENIFRFIASTLFRNGFSGVFNRGKKNKCASQHQSVLLSAWSLLPLSRVTHSIIGITSPIVFT
jgi:hypothetical protein